MRVGSRQQACLTCASSKRRCDKQLPECQRCLDRDVDCSYPQRKRRRKNPIAGHSQTEAFFTLEGHAAADAMESGLALEGWGAPESAADFDLSLTDVITPYIPALSASSTNLAAPSFALDGGVSSSTPFPWFLRDETWVLQHSNQEPACATKVELEPFIHVVGEMLQSWVKNGHNNFIHRRLYENGMPTCLQNAFTALAAYTGRTPAVKETILQIAEEHSCALACQSPPPVEGAQGILGHLARVQALFVYEFIRLFDDSVRLRTSAEQQLPTLRLWVVSMRKVAKQYCEEDQILGRFPLPWTAYDFDSEYNSSTELWKLWILTESVRRTHLIVDTFANVYEIMTKGWVDCDGAVMLTARRGLWEADSAVKWFELFREQSPLLVPSLRPGPLISQYAAEEIDDFVKTYWTFIVGPDKIQYWIDKSNKTSRS